MNPPVALRRPHTVETPFGATREDPYYWLRDDERADPGVIGYLDAENAYADAVLAPLKPLQDRLYDEIVGRIKQDDSSVPTRERGWWYYARYEAGRDYPVQARRKDGPGVDAASILAANAEGNFDAEDVLLDVNAMAEGRDYFSIGEYDVSPDNRLLAWTEDTTGRRQYTLRMRDLATGMDFPEAIHGLSSDLVWAADGQTLLYIENDPETLLTTRVRSHAVGTDPAADPVLHEEDDDSFYIGIGRTRDDRYLTIDLHSTVSSEVRHAPAGDPRGFSVLSPRERDVEYDADHFDGRWVIRTNAPGVDGVPAKDFKLVTAADGSASRAEWVDWIAHDPAVHIEGFELFDGFTAIGERSGGLERIRLLHADGTQSFVQVDEAAYSMWLDDNPEPGTEWLRYGYTSLTTPAIVYETHVRTGERRLLKQQPVLGGFDASRYVTERAWVPARDGTQVPVSIVHRRDVPRDGTAPLLQYGYGSYGASMDPSFNASLVSLLDRGMVYAIAHIRGGQEMGRVWYESGRMQHKQNTFTDFIDVTRWLVANRHAAKDRVAAMGGSAGGLLMGAIANMAPADYRVIVSQVPFVDVVTTMLDPTIPLTTNEYDEWGNPEQRDAYDWMLAYSPYDNLRAQAYPAMYVGTGLWDSQVQYWEPAKYVAKLRTLDTSDTPVVMRTNMDAGHGGKSGRFRRYRETAEMYAFLLTQLGATG